MPSLDAQRLHDWLCRLVERHELEPRVRMSAKDRMYGARENPWKKQDGIVVAESEPERSMITAQRFRIFESRIKKLMGVPYNGSWRVRGQSLALLLWRQGRKAEVLDALRYAFAAGTSVQERTGFLVPGTQKETARARAHATERAARPLEEQFESRQNYEEMLALGRDKYYRVVHESGHYVVWPWQSGQAVYKTREAAVRRALALSRTADPRRS